MRECGLKHDAITQYPIEYVTPHAGVWIETIVSPSYTSTCVVTPHAGVWIETLPPPNKLPILGHSPCGSVD